MSMYSKVAVIISRPFDARVMEIPTPRWTAYDAKPFGVKMDKNVPLITQERAYTSPIGYTPCERILDIGKLTLFMVSFRRSNATEKTRRETYLTSFFSLPTSMRGKADILLSMG